ncbi:preprotein translocase subunit SecG [Pelagibius litoralis]|uniref:Protein-export membrane protein SecG n=1 Tax=Pelagibius litoralis TaxID=374515 RepID=A0A967CAD9_9PROT|nr:preprotein translocase subunit SecG [Pelagibius litoralis]NIA67334.1 preprotein translocase subunit SecG [Pelagibius litoralis]
MQEVLLVVHILLALALIGVVLLQRSEGGGLGIGGGGGGGGGGMGGFLTGRGTANLLTRTTAILAACFMATSITLTILAGGGDERRSIVDQLPAGPTQSAPIEPALPAEPAEPSVPAQ